jgi:uncharacterized protein DUF6348
MSEQLLDALQAAFSGHGIAAERGAGLLRAEGGLTLEPRVFPREAVGGTAQVQVDFTVASPRLGPDPLLDSYAGVGATAEEAERNAFGKFLQASFHVIAETLTTHRRDDSQVEWETWTGAQHQRWQVCSGPLLMLATRGGARIDGFGEFFPVLAARFRETMPAGPHWMRLFLGSLNGQHSGSEVLVDGVVWDAGQALVDAHPWVYPEGYASLRHLLIALPTDA